MFKLSHNDKQNILSEFPNIKLSYEKLAYKKVYNSDLILGIPQGKKCFAWFTIYNDKPTCLIMELHENKQISNIRIVNACFSERLSYGTIVYGTLFYYLNQQFFSIEDIFMDKGKSVYRTNWGTKLDMVAHLLKDDIKQLAFTKYFIVFGLPIIAKSHEDFDEQIKKSPPYPLAHVQYRKSDMDNNYFYCSIKEYNEFYQARADPYKTIKHEENICQNDLSLQTNTSVLPEKPRETDIPFIKNVIFEIKPDIQNDIYHLYCANDEYYGVASIPDYKTSIEMNNLFRRIKENNDLDALEESDAEDEFENSREDKFVDLEKSVKMICKYNRRFKKWYPVKMAYENQAIIDIGLAKAFVAKLSTSNKKIYPVYTSV